MTSGQRKHSGRAILLRCILKAKCLELACPDVATHRNPLVQLPGEIRMPKENTYLYIYTYKKERKKERKGKRKRKTKSRLLVQLRCRRPQAGSDWVSAGIEEGTEKTAEKRKTFFPSLFSLLLSSLFPSSFLLLHPSRPFLIPVSSSAVAEGSVSQQWPPMLSHSPTGT